MVERLFDMAGSPIDPYRPAKRAVARTCALLYSMCVMHVQHPAQHHTSLTHGRHANGPAQHMHAQSHDTGVLTYHAA